MTLGFGVGFVLDTVVDADIAQAALVTLAQHSPAGMVRLVWFVSPNEDEVREVRADGRISRSTETAEMLQAIRDAGAYASWTWDGAPLGIPGLILPGTGWDVPALLATPAMQRLANSWGDIKDNVECSDDVRLGAEADALLAVAKRYHLLTRGGW